MLTFRAGLRCKTVPMDAKLEIPGIAAEAYPETVLYRPIIASPRPGAAVLPLQARGCSGGLWQETPGAQSRGAQNAPLRVKVAQIVLSMILMSPSIDRLLTYSTSSSLVS